MVITIFGATGMVGSRLVQQALSQGFDVKAFGRNVTPLIDSDLAISKLKAIKGYVLDEEDVLKALEGSEAVLSALGGGIDGNDKTRSLGMKNIVTQMNKAGIKRIVGIGGLGVLDTPDDQLIMELPSYPHQYLAVAKEHYAAYMHLRNSPLDWTFVCPPNIHDEDGTGIYY
jgi:putative NADH-flavin reductase